MVGVGDVNGDGRPDLAVLSLAPSSFDGTLQIYLTNADGTFTAVASAAIPNSGATRSIAIGDVDGDGHADLVLGGCCNYDTTAVFAGNGDGTFGSEQTVGVGPNTQAVALADLNGDGLLDLIAAQSNGIYTDVFINRPQATTPPPATPTVTISASPTTITLGAGTSLTWSSTNASSCTASGGWAGTLAISGTQSVTPSATGSVIYGLSCTNGTTSASASATVTVNAASPPPAPPSSSSSSDGGAFEWFDLLGGFALAAYSRRRRNLQRGITERAGMT